MQFPVNKLSKWHLLAIKQLATATATDKEAETCPSRACPFPQKPSGPGLCREDHTHTQGRKKVPCGPRAPAPPSSTGLAAGTPGETSSRCKRWQQPPLWSSQAWVTTPGCSLQCWWGMSPPQGQQPFSALSHCAQDGFFQLSLLSCPLVNDHSSFPYSFIQFL